MDQPRYAVALYYPPWKHRVQPFSNASTLKNHIATILHLTMKSRNKFGPKRDVNDPFTFIAAGKAPEIEARLQCPSCWHHLLEDQHEQMLQPYFDADHIIGIPASAKPTAKPIVSVAKPVALVAPPALPAPIPQAINRDTVVVDTNPEDALLNAMAYPKHGATAVDLCNWDHIPNDVVCQRSQRMARLGGIRFIRRSPTWQIDMEQEGKKNYQQHKQRLLARFPHIDNYPPVDE